MNWRRAFLAAGLVTVGGGAAMAWAAEKLPRPEPKPGVAVNVTGTWASSVATFPFHLTQRGSLVTGRSALDGRVTKGYVRGHWDSGRLLLVYSKVEDTGECFARVVYTLASDGTVSPLNGTAFNVEPPSKRAATLVQKTTDPGNEFAYPYDLELRQCGNIPAFELLFEANSFKLRNPESPLLEAVGRLLKAETGARIQVVGHTDDSGDAPANRDLSRRRAEVVKKVLIDTYGAQENQIAAEGMGPEKPMVPNENGDFRAVNRRIEILLKR